jgi:hypothetical protein
MADLEKLQREIDHLDVCDLHDILHLQNTIEWFEWYFNIDKNDNAIRTAEKFHQELKKLKPSSSITREIDTIERTFLKFLPEDHQDWYRVRHCFKQARDEDSPISIVKADISGSAVNTYHALKLYCTLLNCPILAQTQEYREALTRIFFHPKLYKYLCSQENKLSWNTSSR